MPSDTARQALVLRFLAGLPARYRFSFADFSRAAACRCTSGDFFDGIHLRASGADKVVDAVLRRFPDAFRGHGLPKRQAALSTSVTPEGTLMTRGWTHLL